MPALPKTAIAALAALALSLSGCRTLDSGRAEPVAETRDVAPGRQIELNPVHSRAADNSAPVEIVATGRGPSTEDSAVAVPAAVSAVSTVQVDAGNDAAVTASASTSGSNTASGSESAPALAVKQKPDGKADNTIVVSIKGKSVTGTDANSERYIKPPVSAVVAVAAQTVANAPPLTYSVYIDGSVGKAGSMDLVVDYDRNAMRFIDSTAAELASGGMVISNDEGGRLRISGVFINGISGPGRLLKLRFAKIGAVSADSTIASGAVFTDLYAKRLDGVGPRNVSMLAEK